jgi:hypothetical protein
MDNKTEEKLLTLFLILSGIAILLIKFILADIPETWKFGQELGELIYDLSLAYIASWTFYVIVVTIPQKRNKRNIYTHAKRITERITHYGATILNGFLQPLDINDIYKEMTEHEFMDLCKKIGPNHTQDLFWTPTEQKVITYAQHINSIRSRIKEESDILFTYMPHLEPEHIRLVNDILYSQVMLDLKVFFANSDYHRQHTSFESISTPLYDFYKKILLLKNYIQKF